MSTLNIALPDTLQAFVEEQAVAQGYEGEADYVRDLIEREQDREALNALLRKGEMSPPGRVADDAYFDDLRARILKQG
ncbi:ribbon-helix-helix domain-containing protein [Caulobacter endophyticus]|uniref:Type II toxin-antitoxin system ParD family antitoxin n=1 Tax=Caulobacter endophyticus TaxID=2172652 RepID=A0A2T9K0L9_9CAUL|nr:type II toxin-antitoxin system ParD family antitoxin [Caulobacter endophyticus]PVM89515.1 type II toxin-antitoxin system ParD family antitoxin [Caulobacter endophyticus]